GLDISPDAVDPADTETLADLIVAAIRDANDKAQAVVTERLGGLAGGAGGGMPGLPGMPPEDPPSRPIGF
ncbi:MAG TPA: YbaB/EbfC family nucleoid-associated protein, partial [Nocardioidaceae bacterium]|nr:YbaB/EbfC family nucleoid-associated protein [Nocardioidaceae bacterium]